MDFRHFIITRFNLKAESIGWNTDKSRNEVLSRDWMTERLRLFNTYCLPSLIRQTVKDFTWIIYLDSETAENIKQEFSELNRVNPWIIPVYVSSHQQFKRQYTSDVLSFLDQKTRFVITTRLDNDDIVHKDFVRTIQQRFDFQQLTAVNLCKVLVLNPENRDLLYRDINLSNHFISIIERITENGIQGCYRKRHVLWRKENEVIQVYDKPYCAEIISDRNLSNKFRGFPVFKVTSLEEYQLEGVYRTRLLNRSAIKFWQFRWKNLLLYHYGRLVKWTGPEKRRNAG